MTTILQLDLEIDQHLKQLSAAQKQIVLVVLKTMVAQNSATTTTVRAKKIS